MVVQLIPLEAFSDSIYGSSNVDIMFKDASSDLLKTYVRRNIFLKKYIPENYLYR